MRHQQASPLHQAVIGENVDNIKFLVQSGADIKARNDDGQSLLHLACDMAHIALFNLLLELGAGEGVDDLETLKEAMQNRN